MMASGAIACEDYVIVKGGSISIPYDPATHILTLSCNDMYEGLPEKVIKAFQYVHDDPAFAKYTHFCKVDEDIVVKALIPTRLLSDYCGRLYNSYIGNRVWHMGKCSPDSRFNKEPYKGIFVPWCLGGNGYFLSRNALKHVIGGIARAANEIYEDLYVAKLLRAERIMPKNIAGLSQYLFSSDHS